MAEIELKPCPFCGNSNEDHLLILVGRGYYYVWCGNCETEGPATDSELQAVVKWNTRI